ncbi:NAD(P)H-quinone oxidoreductase subunit N [Marchantia polymorpha subsp. ruderalis]|uniref:NAD(P)H-quinone oxidoreductase subunit N, chloroplastic n=2 Tax=Marchantia polymorpha TaxID=3197 RepID=A0AAF6BJS6_MARPO|nr:hypothetical protein MARPO_0073s0080 [Marchantia polymorpha]BBN12260.1 hypothetical protein Mp_5g18600 [Marchantia polymorpha subsp. ruderalis]|eukprot:PTQ35215.1 hypothetical protein MARPO_0073s0080 [Marchantia polymorpha]
MTVNVCAAQCHLSTAAAAAAAAAGSSQSQRNQASLSSSAVRLGSTFVPKSKSLRTSCSSSSSGSTSEVKVRTTVEAGLGDYIGGDLLGFDLDKWSSDVEEFGSIGIYSPPEGGYEGRYATRLRREGYHILNLTARGLGDPEAYLTKIHGVRPPHLGKQAIARWYMPPEVDYRLSLLPKDCKGLVVWMIECKVLSKTELQFLALLPALRPKVKVIAECGPWRSFRWKPLKEIAGLPMTTSREAAEAPAASVPTASSEVEKEKKSATDKVVA